MKKRAPAPFAAAATAHADPRSGGDASRAEFSRSKTDSAHQADAQEPRCARARTAATVVARIAEEPARTVRCAATFAGHSGAAAGPTGVTGRTRSGEARIAASVARAARLGVAVRDARWSTANVGRTSARARLTDGTTSGQRAAHEHRAAAVVDR